MTAHRHRHKGAGSARAAGRPNAFASRARRWRMRAARRPPSTITEAVAPKRKRAPGGITTVREGPLARPGANTQYATSPRQPAAQKRPASTPGRALAARKPQGRGDCRSRARASQGPLPAPHGSKGPLPTGPGARIRARGRKAQRLRLLSPSTRTRAAHRLRAPPPRPWPRAETSSRAGIPHPRLPGPRPLATAQRASFRLAPRSQRGRGLAPPGGRVRASGRKAQRLRLPSPPLAHASGTPASKHHHRGRGPEAETGPGRHHHGPGGSPGSAGRFLAPRASRKHIQQCGRMRQNPSTSTGFPRFLDSGQGGGPPLPVR